MTVAANCKQVLTIAIAVFLFDLHINFTNGIGIILTLIGGVSRYFLHLLHRTGNLILTSILVSWIGLVRLDRIPGKEQQGTSVPTHSGPLGVLAACTLKGSKHTRTYRRSRHDRLVSVPSCKPQIHLVLSNPLSADKRSVHLSHFGRP
jgi:hypothetical protein